MIGTPNVVNEVVSVHLLRNINLSILLMCNCSTDLFENYFFEERQRQSYVPGNKICQHIKTLGL